MTVPARNLMRSALRATIGRNSRVSTGILLQTSTRNSSSSTQYPSGDDLDVESLKERRFYYEDQILCQPIDILQRALKSCLPEHVEAHSFKPDWLPLGFQHTFFRPALYPEELCDDGTDTKFLPGPQEIWKYRLWAGGSVALHKRIPDAMNGASIAGLLEHASKVRVVSENGQAKRVFVTIERSVFTSLPASSYAERRKLITSDEKRFAQAQMKPILTETENICFLREPPVSLQDERRIKPSLKPLYQFTAVPDRNLLFQFSALTYNAHNIHLDRQSAQQEYGARDLIVHGPLTQVIMIEFLKRFLSQVWPDKSVLLVPKNISYTNVSPLFVNEPLTICCRPGPKFENAPIEQVTSWSVWIQKGSGDDASLAVKAIIHVDALSYEEIHAARAGETPEKTIQEVRSR